MNGAVPEIAHRSFTHTWGEGVVLPAIGSLFSKARAKTFTWLGAGVVGHLFLDSCMTLEERMVYLGTIGVALLLQKYAEGNSTALERDISKISSANNNV